MIAPSGMPLAIPFALQMMSGSISGMFERPPFAGAAHAGLHFVANQHDAVLAADAAQFLQEKFGAGT